MPLAAKHFLDSAATEVVTGAVRAVQIDTDSPRREEAEEFIHSVFQRHHAARVSSFAPQLLLIETPGQVLAAAGWRGAGEQQLFLERYLDDPVDVLLARLTGQPLSRGRVVEVGHLASEKAGASLHVIVALARHLAQAGYEWVVFTATRELVRLFTRLGLPLLALAKADPARLGDEAAAWGRYYDTQPVVVAGRIRLGLERVGA